ncbi:MAG: hypothetical protein ACJ8NS_00655 [Chthoniobacterales bacterium]
MELRPGLIEIFGKDTRRRAFFVLFVLSTVACAIATSLHYTGKYRGNPVTWVAFVWALVFLLATYFPSGQETKDWAARVWQERRFLGLFGVLALLFVVSHIWNFKTAPWNQNGLFDDAAWDIYFAKQHIFSHEPFQAAISEGIAREVGLHYYIWPWFILFGWNLLTFNVALLALGLTTFIFTCLIVHEFFKNFLVTIVSALVFNFLPLHFIQTFVGHRYAMAAPLLTASLYFLITGFSRDSAFRVALSAILAAFCMESAIMGKHYLMCLAGAALVSIAVDRKGALTTEKVRLTIVFVIALVAALLPLIGFIYYNRTVYFAHERELTDLFFQAYRNRASGALTPYLNDLKNIFFAPASHRRLSMPDYVIIPFWYYVFLLPGIGIALFKKRFEIVLLAIVPVLGAFVSTAYDFRVLHAAPFWVILMAFTFHALTKLEKITRSYLINLSVLAIAGGCLAAGWLPSVRYLYEKSKNPFSIFLLSQHDVCVARFIQDIVAGAPHPSPRRKHDEFRRFPGPSSPAYDAFVCNETGFAIMHLFLQDYGDQEIMSFCNELPMLHFSGSEVFAMNKKALEGYRGTKGVMLIWQETFRSAAAINAFQKIRHLGSDKRLQTKHGARSYAFYVLTIPKENIGQLKHELATLNL